MSIQDESFPYDDLDTSRNSAQHMVFPHHNPRLTKLNSIDQVHTATVSRIDEDIYDEDASATSSPKNRDDSMQSSNDGPPESETSGKTNASEPQGKKSCKMLVGKLNIAGQIGKFDKFLYI